MKGALIVSLDFELFWGVQDVETLEGYGKNVLGTWDAIPKLLQLFNEYQIHATWATVGFMFAQNYAELIKYFPEEKDRPSYKNEMRSSYRCFEEVAVNEDNRRYFYGLELINEIAKHDGQEIGSHTFSHYYCDEIGQNLEQFYADMHAAKTIAQDKGYDLKSFVFPRNQSVDEYVRILENLGYTSYRSMAENWIHHKVKKGIIRRGLRLLDVYLPLTGSNTYLPKESKGIINFPGSNMYKPKCKSLFFLEWMKILRIKQQMKKAAKKGTIYHLWWHPHNIGANTEFHLKQLAEIFAHYQKLKNKYDMQSLNMAEAVDYYQK